MVNKNLKLQYLVDNHSHQLDYSLDIFIFQTLEKIQGVSHFSFQIDEMCHVNQAWALKSGTNFILPEVKNYAINLKKNSYNNFFTTKPKSVKHVAKTKIEPTFSVFIKNVRYLISTLETINTYEVLLEVLPITRPLSNAPELTQFGEEYVESLIEKYHFGGKLTRDLAPKEETKVYNKL